MPRAPRIHYPGAVYHAMARGVDGREIFSDDSDREMFLATTRSIQKETSCAILAYCLMGNHFHFTLRVKSIPLSRIMQRILTTYAMAFNFRHDREGHLFQARYKSVLCLDDAYLIALIRYIHMNPVRAGLVSIADDWPWSSHSLYAKNSDDGLIDRRLFFNALNGQPYAEWMNGRDEAFNPWSEAKSKSPLLREEEIIDDVDTETLDEIASDMFPDDLIMVRSGSRRRDLAYKRLLLAERALKRGHYLSTIAEWLGRTPQAVHALIQRNKLNK